jgi:tartrate-resistant acid phosphatase type 5
MLMHHTTLPARRNACALTPRRFTPSADLVRALLSTVLVACSNPADQGGLFEAQAPTDVDATTGQGSEAHDVVEAGETAVTPGEPTDAAESLVEVTLPAEDLPPDPRDLPHEHTPPDAEPSAPQPSRPDGPIGDAIDGIVRFVTFGDWGGAPSRIQRAADAMWAHCRTAGCDFVIGLGDNFYGDGVSGLDDPQWQNKFEVPFAQWHIPFFMTLGNHDYRGDAMAQVAYTAMSDKWVMRDRYYDFAQGPVHFLALDTNRMDRAQLDWVQARIAASRSVWRIAFGHHQWRSNGNYGNAGSARRAFFEWAFCERIDLWINGHEHDLQHLAPDCGVDIVISGAVERVRRTNVGANTRFALGDYGFVWIEVSDQLMTMEFRDLDGALLHRALRTARPSSARCGGDGVCVAECAHDPDCAHVACADDGICEPACESDPDCYDRCPCDFRFAICEPLNRGSTTRCGCDPQCRGEALPCTADGHCDTWCPSAVDPDCGP